LSLNNATSAYAADDVGIWAQRRFIAANGDTYYPTYSGPLDQEGLMMLQQMDSLPYDHGETWDMHIVTGSFYPNLVFSYTYENVSFRKVFIAFRNNYPSTCNCGRALTG